MKRRPGWLPATPVGRWRVAVLAVAVAATTVKLVVAVNTFGTDDVHIWTDFARAVREYGPVEIYGRPLIAQYNHPPLAGLLLVALAWLVDNGVAGLPFLIRVPASVADVATAMLLFELIRRTRSLRAAGAAGILVSLSPALITISGFHGNTDPVFVMLALLSVYLVVTRHAFGAGLAFAAAVSVKLVPVVIAPVLLVVLARAGWRRVAAFLGGGAVVAAALWGPVLLLAWPEFRDNVLRYSGVSLRQWGVPQFLVWAQRPTEWVEFVTGPGRFLVLLISAAVPAVLVWLRPAAVAPAVGLSLALFLLLSPAFGMQYLVWPLAAAYLIANREATAYNVAASLFVISVYDNWNSAYPWDWFEGRAGPFRSQDLLLMVVTWAALAAVVAAALRMFRQAVPARPERRTEAASWRTRAQREADLNSASRAQRNGAAHDNGAPHRNGVPPRPSKTALRSSG
jgi:hypothetical protein